MYIEDIYWTIQQFCKNHKYPLPPYLMILAEKDLTKKCASLKRVVKKTTDPKTNQVECQFPQDILEDYFQLWVKK